MIYPVVLAGGSGSRLWPVSSRQTPKQFLKLFGDRSLYQHTLGRLTGLCEPTHIRTSCNSAHQSRIEAELLALGLPTEGHVIAEPVARNTAPAIYMAAKRLLGQDPEAILIVLPADHHVADVPGFQASLRLAVAAAERDRIVTLGIQPTAPETGYGYIETDGVGQVTPVLRFVEKPDAARAAEYLASGRFLWNSGMFVFRASVMVEEFCTLQAEIVAAVDAFLNGDANAYARAPKISVDYAVMERTRRAEVVRASFGWSDVGTWAAVLQQQETDDLGNALIGDVVARDCRNTLIRADHRRVAAFGLDDLLVVASGDGVLVCHKDAAQAVGEVGEVAPNVEAVGYTEHRPWGSFTILGSDDSFKSKRLDVLPGARLSLQSHKFRSEYWVVAKGRARVTLDDALLDLAAGETVTIPVGARHRVENPGPEPLILIEVQLGSYFGEDDITRFQDDFNRS